MCHCALLLGFGGSAVGVQAIFVVVAVAWTILGYFPLLRQLDAAMKRSRALLLLFPDDVILGVTTIKNHFLEYSRSFGVV